MLLPTKSSCVWRWLCSVGRLKANEPNGQKKVGNGLKLDGKVQRPQVSEACSKTGVSVQVCQEGRNTTLCFPSAWPLGPKPLVTTSSLLHLICSLLKRPPPPPPSPQPPAPAPVPCGPPAQVLHSLPLPGERTRCPLAEVIG